MKLNALFDKFAGVQTVETSEATSWKEVMSNFTIEIVKEQFVKLIRDNKVLFCKDARTDKSETSNVKLICWTYEKDGKSFNMGKIVNA